MLEPKIKIAGISGSLREASHNTAAIHAIKQVLPENVEYEILDLSQIPFFSEDLEAAGIPTPVLQLVARLAAAQAVIIASPEYNGMISGYLKNALDWISRPSVRKAIEAKPFGLIGASVTPYAGARANKQLFTLLTNMRTAPLEGSEVLIGEASGKFSLAGELLDPAILEKLRQLVEKLVEAVTAKTSQEIAA